MNLSNEQATILGSLIGALALIVTTIVTMRWQRRHDVQEEAKEKTPPAHPQPVDLLTNILSTKIMRIGCVKHPPLSDFTYVRGSPQCSGWYVQLCEVVCKANGLVPVYEPVDWSEIPDKVFTDRKLDLVLSVFATAERAARADFAACFHAVDVTGITRSDNPKVRSVGDLFVDDVRVVVARGEAGWEYVTRDLHLPSYRVLEVTTSNLVEIMDYVLSGRADVAICDSVTCYNYQQAHPDVSHVFIQDHIFTCRNGIMVPRGQEQLQRWVDVEFSKARNTTEIAAAEMAILAQPPQLIRRYT